MKRSTVRTLVNLLLLSALSACVPGVSSVERPIFRPIPESLTLVRLDPPGVGAGTATFRLDLEVDNPNAFDLSLSKLDFELFINGKRAAQGSSEGVSLPPNGSERLRLDFTVALSEAPELLGDMARLVVGETLPYRLEGAATVEAFGLSRRLSNVTLAEGEVAQPVALTAPTFRYLPESGLRALSLNRVVVAVGLALDNPTPFGYVFSAPAIALKLDGQTVAEAGVAAQPVPAFASATLTLRFELRPTTLGVALVEKLAKLSSGAGLDLELSGRFALELPGMLTRDFSVERLLTTILR